MEDIISKSVGDFNQFLTGHEATLKKRPGSSLISFAALLSGNEFSFLNSINNYIKSPARSFYFCQPDKAFGFLAVNSCVVISENGPGRFASTDRKIKEWKDKLLHNWDELNTRQIPLFTGGMKFTPEHPDDLWNDFYDSSWFVPEFLLIENAGKNFLVFNFIYQKGSDKNSLVDRYKKIFESIIKNSKEPVPALPALPGIKEFEGGSPKDKKKWKQLVTAGIEELLDKKAEKIVYSRKIGYILNKEADFKYITSFLGDKYPGCTVFAFHQGNSVFFGATPEKLAVVSNSKIEIDALAGSAPRGKDDTEDEMLAASLLTDNKNLIEHNFVVNYIINALKNFSSEIEQGTTGIKKLKNIQHLYTGITAKLKTTGLLFQLISDLFPTPAVCGVPRKAALENIKKNEPFNRGMYAGLIGWLNMDEYAEFVVAIRSAVIKGNKLYVFAGGGIVADSNPEEEFNETELKLKPILSIFQNEN
jgi:menaquinone-specific isochorismate synthase